MPNKKIIIASLTVVFLLVCLYSTYILIANKPLSMEGIDINEEQLIEDLNVLLGKERLKGINKLVDNASDEYGLSNVEYFTFNINKMVSNNTKVLFVSCQNDSRNPFGSSGQLSKPLEMRYIAQTYLYCRNRELPYDIIGYSVSFTPFVGVLAYRAATKIKIDVSELTNIYQKYNIDKLIYEQQVDELTKAIIKETSYRRVWSPNDDYLKDIECNLSYHRLGIKLLTSEARGLFGVRNHRTVSCG